MDEVYLIEEAIELLKQRIILKNKKGAIFALKNKKIYIHSLNASFVTSLEDFSTIYKDDEFVIYQDSEFEVDSLKDKEYYSFKHK